ncbi:type I restriction-modification system subunit M [Dehalococcoidia bacterium]|nr:type I restriction-modification system subunit M [Dehalococcoidia bacterium]
MTTVSSQSSMDAKIENICKILRRGNVTGAMQYVPEITWLLFLRILDEREELEQIENELLGSPFSPSLSYPYRWKDWASPNGKKRKELQNGASGDVFDFVNNDLIPHLRTLHENFEASPGQKLISRILSSVEVSSVDTERILLDALDKIDEIKQNGIDPTHVFTLSQVFEGLLLRMGDKKSDGGQFFTPREVIRAIIKVLDPKIGETVYDPCCGTGGFLAQTFEYIQDNLGDSAIASQMDTLSRTTLYGREKDKVIFPITLANLKLHGVDAPGIWHGNTLTNQESYGELFTNAPELFDVVMMNPPFGGTEDVEAQTKYPYKTGKTQFLFLQEVMDSLTATGRAGVVVDEGLLFRTDETAFVQIKRKLIDEFNLFCIVSLPAGVFVAAGAGVKTNILFFNNGDRTENIWYYDLTDLKVNKRNPMTIKYFEEFFNLLPTKPETERSWTVTRSEIEEKNYDLKAVNPNRVEEVDTRTPEELIDVIEQKGSEIKEALSVLRSL